MSLRVAGVVYGIAAVVAVIAYYVWPVLRPVSTAVVGGMSVAAICFGLVRLRPQRRGAWLFIALAVLLIATGDTVFAAAAGDQPTPVRYPAPPGVLYLLAYLPLAVGLLWLGRPRLPSRDWPMLLDAIALSLAGSLVVWMIVARPVVTNLRLDGVEKIIVIGGWIGYVAVLATAARVLLIWRTNLSLGLLAAGVVAFLIADFFYVREVVNGLWSTGGLVDLGFLAFGILAGAAALTPSMRTVASAAHARHQLGPVRLAMITAVLLVGPTTLLAEATAGPLGTRLAIALVSAAVGVLMVVRLVVSARAYRDRANREHAIRVASRALVLATNESEVADAVRDASQRIWIGREQAQVRLEDRNGGSEAELVPVPPDGAIGEFRANMGGTDAPPQRLVFSAAMDDLVELSPVLRALADQAHSALFRIRLLARLRADEREQYFRTLVLTSDDVTLISQDGRVRYATPSASEMFGRDVTGERFDNLLERAPGQGEQPSWPTDASPVEGRVRRPDGTELMVRVRRRDLTADPTVAGVVTTLHDVTGERRLQQDLAHRATHDPLTGLANPELFGAELERERAGPVVTGTSRAALFIDLDEFKTVNDTHGHQVGDGLLVEVARRIQDCVGPGDLAARLGGDEFAVLLRSVDSIEAARATAERVARALARPATIDGATVNSQASIGLAYAEYPGNLDGLLREADTALYTAKAMGKGHWREYQEGMRTPTRRNQENMRRIEAALDTGALTLHYQPIVALDSGRAAGFEALIRMADEQSPLAPQEIITTAEETGFMPRLGDWILRRATADLARLNPPEASNQRYLSVNISPRQLRQHDFVTRVRNYLREARARPSLLVLEVTENLRIEQDSREWSLLAQLREDGVRVAIDDYGTGYASLSYLRQRAIDLVKIDQSLLADLTDERNRILLEEVVKVCQRLHLDQVAEGVADQTTADIVREMGCRYGQGFHFAAAMPIDEAVRWDRAPAYGHAGTARAAWPEAAQ